jgi:hypothetical protein
MNRALQTFPRVYNADDFGLAAATVCQPNQWNTIGEVQVPAGQKIRFGIGGLGATDSREICYVQLSTAAGVILQGRLRFVVADPNEVRTHLVADQRTERTAAHATDRTQGFLLGESGLAAGQDARLQIQYMPDGAAAVTIDGTHADTGMLIPVTVYQ